MRSLRYGHWVAMMLRSEWIARRLFSIIALVAGAHLRHPVGVDADSTWQNGAIRVSVSLRAAVGATAPPVRAATVTLPGVSLRAQTDSTGIASFERLTAGDYDVDVTTPTTVRFGEEPISTTVHVVDDSVTTISMLVPTEGGQTIGPDLEVPDE